MCIIKIDNVKSKIMDLAPNYLNLLAQELSVKVPNYYFSPAFRSGRWDGKQHFLTRPSNTFPTGLLPKVVTFLEDTCEVTPVIEDCRENLTDLNLPTLQMGYVVGEDKELRRYQVDTINAIATNTVLGVPFQRGVVNIATNGGKTVIAEGIIGELYSQLRNCDGVFLFATHSKEIAYQAHQSLQNDLQIEVGFIGDGQWDVKTVTVAIITTVYRRMKDKKPEFMELKDKVRGLVADEAHHSVAASFYEVFSQLNKASIRLGLTGTVDKKNLVNAMKLYSCTGDIVSKISNDYLIQQGVSAKPICIMFKVDKPELGGMEYQDAYRFGIVENEIRHDIIYDICAKETSAHNTVLILVERIEHGQNLEEVLKPLCKEVYFTNGQLSSGERVLLLDKLRNGELDVLISSNILDEGVDVSGINAVIYARGMKSMRKLLQGIGRGLRLKDDNSKLRFYDFIDDTHIKLLLHSQERYETLAAEKFVVKLMDVQSYNSASWEEINKEAE